MAENSGGPFSPMEVEPANDAESPRAAATGGCIEIGVKGYERGE
jgi:hypothetical protein